MMIDPVIGDNPLRSWCRCIVNYCGRWFPKHVIYPLVIALPPALLTALVLKGDPEKTLGEDWGAIVKTWSPLFVVLLCAVYLTLVKATYALIESYAKPPRELDKYDYLAIFEALDVVVTGKAIRMKNKAREILSSKTPVCAAKTFHQITQPERQIELLVKGIRSVFEFLSQRKVDYKLGLLKIDGEKPVEWITFSPFEDPPLDAPILADPQSTVSHCISKKKIVIVGDIEKELKKKKNLRYLPIGDPSLDCGSLLCLPIAHPSTKETALVLSVYGNKANCLNEKHFALHTWVLNHFVIRLSMEYNLLLMKGNADEPRN